MTLSIKQFQKQFVDSLYGDICQNDIAKIIKNNSNLPKDEFLEIYKNNLLISLTDVLIQIYKNVTMLVGEEYISYLAKKYIKQNPSQDTNLDLYGFDFPHFLSNLDIVKNQLPYLPDMAILDLLIHKSYLADDSFIYDVKETHNQDYDFANTKIELNKSLFTLSSHFPIYQIWYMNDNPDKENTIDLGSSQGENILIYRDDSNNFKIMVEKISDIKYKFIKLVKENKNIGEIFNISEFNENKKTIENLLNNLLEKKLICRFF